MTKFTKSRPLTEIEQVRQAFPLYDKTPHRTTTDALGNIISIETNNTALKAILLARGFVED